MRMSIEEAIPILHDMYNYYNDTDIDAYVGFDKEDNNAMETALDTMRKYQKIEQILKSLDDGEINYPQMTYYLRKVLKDENCGNPDSLNLHS